jgi:hypothetical protein
VDLVTINSNRLRSSDAHSNAFTVYFDDSDADVACNDDLFANSPR